MQAIYLDNAATTRVETPVAQGAYRVMTEEYGNPSSLHRLGLRAERLIEAATQSVLRVLGTGSGRVVFTGSGTEADNIALFGAALQRSGRGRHIITTAIEHPAVLGPMKELERQGYTLTLLRPGPGGTVSVEALAEALRPDTILVSVMAVGNETGAMQDIPAMVRLTREKSPHALFHCDAIQAFGKLPFHVGQWGVDLLSLSGHKIGAPKGIGALYLADRVHIAPVVFGGGQQQGLRPGTESVPLIHALGLAADLAMEHREAAYEQMSRLQAQLLEGLGKMPGVVVHLPSAASPYILHFSLPGYRAEVVLHFLENRNIYVSSGSACSRGALSPVLTAMGLPRREIEGALRVSFSRHNTPDDVQALLNALQDAQTQLIKAR